MCMSGDHSSAEPMEEDTGQMMGGKAGKRRYRLGGNAGLSGTDLDYFSGDFVPATAAGGARKHRRRPRGGMAPVPQKMTEAKMKEMKAKEEKLKKQMKEMEQKKKEIKKAQKTINKAAKSIKM